MKPSFPTSTTKTPDATFQEASRRSLRPMFEGATLPSKAPDITKQTKPPLGERTGQDRVARLSNTGAASALKGSFQSLINRRRR